MTKTDRPVKPKDDQIEEWMESPVAEYFVHLLRERLDDSYEGRNDAYVFGQPQITQETFAWCAGEESVWDTLIDVFQDKSFDEIEEQESEHIGNPPDVGPRTH